jgi:hypothetical protein
VRHLLNVEKAIKKAIKINFDERDKWKVSHQVNTRNTRIILCACSTWT